MDELKGLTEAKRSELVAKSQRGASYKNPAKGNR